MVNPSLTPHNPNICKLYDDYVYYMGDPIGFNKTTIMMKKWNDDIEHRNDNRLFCVIEHTQDYCSAIIIKKVQQWRKNTSSKFSEQAEGNVHCAMLLHAIMLTLDESARQYYDENDMSARTLFIEWIKSYEYLLWVDKHDYKFPFGSIQQYCYQLCIVKIIPEWVNGILSDDKKHKSHINGSPLLYYLGIGTTYNNRDTLSLNVYFASMKKALNKIAKSIIKFGKTLMDCHKLCDNLCSYLMENIVNCDYTYILYCK
jgi:hypothetical protein